VRPGAEIGVRRRVGKGDPEDRAWARERDECVDAVLVHGVADAFDGFELHGARRLAASGDVDVREATRLGSDGVGV
jgi:hypothetical protein